MCVSSAISPELLMRSSGVNSYTNLGRVAQIFIYRDEEMYVLYVASSILGSSKPWVYQPAIYYLKPPLQNPTSPISHAEMRCLCHFILEVPLNLCTEDRICECTSYVLDIQVGVPHFWFFITATAKNMQILNLSTPHENFMVAHIYLLRFFSRERDMLT